MRRELALSWEAAALLLLPSLAAASAAAGADPDGAAAIAEMRRDLTKLRAQVDAAELSTNHTWIMLAGIMCFFLQAGFALLEAGAIRSKNVKNIMIKNLLDACIGGIAYFLFGYAFAYGSPGDGTGNEFSGGELDGYFMMLNMPKDEYYIWFFQWVFAATTATIVSGAVAERVQFTGYLVYSVALTGFIYPWCSHWIWSADGFLNKLGTFDYAGGGAVHALAGVAAFCGAYYLGPRIGRFASDGTPIDINGHNSAMMALGVFILWFGFIPFNSGSGVAITQHMSWVSARIAVMTSMAGCSGGCVAVLLGYYRTQTISLEYAVNGVLAGMVSMCSCCAVIEIWAATICVAPFAVFVFYGLQDFLLYLQVDDPLGASSLHWGAGAWGMLVVGFFATPEYTELMYGCEFTWAREGDSCADYYGIFYGGSGKQLGIQLLAIAVNTVYGLVTCGLLFSALSRLGLLRVSKEDELNGMDISHHGSHAYSWLRVPAYEEGDDLELVAKAAGTKNLGSAHPAAAADAVDSQTDVELAPTAPALGDLRGEAL